MKTLDKIHKLVTSKYTELEAYTKTYSREREVLMKDMETKYKGNFLKDPDSIDIKVIAKDYFYKIGFHQMDVRTLQMRFLAAYLLYKELDGDKEFTPDLEGTVGVLKKVLLNQMYVENSGKFNEIVEGEVDRISEDYEAKGYYKMFEGQLNKLFNE